MKPCIKCGTELVLGENWTEARKKEFVYKCKECSKLAKEDARRHNLWQKWKLRERDYRAILKSQGGGCMLCGRTEEEEGRALAVDHVHDSDPTDIRGLLCTRCNNGLGNFMENIETLENAIHYLKCDYHKMQRAA